MEGYGAAFFYWSKIFEKSGFRQNGFWRNAMDNQFLCKKIFFSNLETFTFPNACAIQINSNELLKKTVLENMGCWQKESETEKW